jgi:hypothetical protein
LLKFLKGRFAVLAIVALAAVGAGGAFASTASATTNCSITASTFKGASPWNQYISSQTSFSSCTDTEAVQIDPTGSGGVDESVGPTQFAASTLQGITSNCGVQANSPNVLGCSQTGLTYASIYQRSFYNFTGTRYFTARLEYRLKNSLTHTWGTWHFLSSLGAMVPITMP